jgi:hypothetical protein
MLELVEQVLRRIEADVAGQQQGLEFFEQFVVDLAAREQRFSFPPNCARVRASPALSRCRHEVAAEARGVRCNGRRHRCGGRVA